MKTLFACLKEAEGKGVALGHFNVSDLVALWAVARAAKETGLPVMVGVSEGEREFMGVKEIRALVSTIREDLGIDIFLNADHTHALQKVEEAARAGFDEILFDGSKLSFEENLRETKKAVEAIKNINPDILVEGELGFIGASSEIVAERPAAVLTDPDQALEFIKETGIDILAPAVGNMHGMLASMVSGEEKIRLHIDRIKELKQKTGSFLTLHGGSGTDDEDFKKAIKAGVNIVHISTEIRLEWRSGIEEALKGHPAEIAPYKLFPEASEKIMRVAANRLRLFNNL